MFERVLFKLNLLSCITIWKYVYHRSPYKLTSKPTTYLFFRSGSPVCGQWRWLANARNQWLFEQWTRIAHLIPFNRIYTVAHVVNVGPLLDSVLLVKYCWPQNLYLELHKLFLVKRQHFLIQVSGKQHIGSGI